ncbi:hypothetical protein RhiirA1_416356 [Rhizophagus irregularis]|uniref:Uncharacterized protein n=1 Tax=Rhizophagus irregularis TaxID=588596 RepID=A0A2N0S051_9GLOM|nr:hypothetical protein RhiirA1_416356 [Rhizophagus irregularis]UZO21547.1 hypothetical protein OCT59_013937 [Rhizophagus irregularis]CAB4467713.1 unnamed protein product [Rhizophagus irregularis]CAB5181706.1 unnamed protein product [Rhizophagus irregularis]
MCLFPVILIVDGMQIALINENDDKDKKSVYYSFLTEISAAATNNDNPLNHCMLHRTFARPFNEMVSEYNQLRVFLPIRPLDPPKRGKCL